MEAEAEAEAPFKILLEAEAEAEAQFEIQMEAEAEAFKKFGANLEEEAEAERFWKLKLEAEALSKSSTSASLIVTLRGPLGKDLYVTPSDLPEPQNGLFDPQSDPPM